MTNLPVDTTDKLLSVPCFFGLRLFDFFAHLTKATIASSSGLIEFGAFLGGSFIPLSLLASSGRIIAIDGFSAFDKSPFDADALLGNMRAVIGDDRYYEDYAERTHVITADCSVISSEDIRRHIFHDTLGMLRSGIVSIVGCADLRRTQNAMKIGSELLAPDGILSVDNYFNFRTPNVSVAVASFLSENRNELLPFAIGHNRIFFTRSCAAYYAYRDAIQESAMDFLHDYEPRYPFFDMEVLRVK